MTAASRKIMIFQHVGHEPLGTLDPMLKAAGFRIRYVNFGRQPDMVPKLEGYAGLIILGGPMGVYDKDLIPHLQVEMRVIEEALKIDIPVLGICLGAQLVAAVLGAGVRKAAHVELGWHEVHLTESGKNDPLFRDYRDPEKIFQLHQDQFDPPKSADHLARSELCEGQAFRYGKKVYGFQFHLEADQAMILRWLNRPENREMLSRVRDPVTIEQVKLHTLANIERSMQISHSIFEKFIEVFQLPARATRLGSSHGGLR